MTNIWGAAPTTWFYDETGEVDRIEDFTPPPVGTGFLWQSARYRIVDVWMSLDPHGRFPAGYHVFLRLVEGEGDDLLGRLAPGYFATGDDPREP